RRRPHFRRTVPAPSGRAQRVDDLGDLDACRPDAAISRAVGEVDRAVRQRYRTLDEDDLVDVATTLPSQLRTQDRLGQERCDATGLLVEKRDLDRVLRGRVSLVVEEQ